MPAKETRGWMWAPGGTANPRRSFYRNNLLCLKGASEEDACSENYALLGVTRGHQRAKGTAGLTERTQRLSTSESLLWRVSDSKMGQRHWLSLELFRQKAEGMRGSPPPRRPPATPPPSINILPLSVDWTP